jgi:hypothetical protein
MPNPIEPRPYVARRWLLVKSNPVPGVTIMQPIRERVVPRAELRERLWLIWAEVLNADDEPAFNGLGYQPIELAQLYAHVRGWLRPGQRPAEYERAIQSSARRWLLRARDVADSLQLTHIGECTDPNFEGPRLQMPFVAYRGGLREDLVRVGPHHQDPARVAILARRRLRYLKGWRLAAIADTEGIADWKVIQSSLRAWKVLEEEVPGAL